MKEKPNYYAIIPADVRYDNNLKDKAKLLYGEITALSNKDGYCYASNKYFAELYGVTITTISTLIKNLIDNGYIESEIIYKEGTKEILNRYLKIFKEGYLKNFKHNNTSINNTSINNKESKKKSFEKPTLEEVKQYCLERNNNVDAKKFFDYYEIGNWKDAKGNKIKNWKQKLITWETHTKEQTQNKPNWFDKEVKEEEASAEEIMELERRMKR